MGISIIRKAALFDKEEHITYCRIVDKITEEHHLELHKNY